MNQNKIAEINLESGSPSVERALQNMVNQMSTCKRQGCKAVILIHGYGSSGAGGSIKAAISKKLAENSMRGLVRLYTGGEDWLSRKKELLSMCASLHSYDRRIAGNEGVTVVILK